LVKHLSMICIFRRSRRTESDRITFSIPNGAGSVATFILFTHSKINLQASTRCSSQLFNSNCSIMFGSICTQSTQFLHAHHPTHHPTHHSTYTPPYPPPYMLTTLLPYLLAYLQVQLPTRYLLIHLLTSLLASKHASCDVCKYTSFAS